MAAGDYGIDVLSSKPWLVTGGKALLRITAPDGTDLGRLTVEVNREDVTSDFLPDPHVPGALLGLVDDLDLGDNRIEVRLVREPGVKGRRVAKETITNYPQSGPIISGPHEEPFFCQTEDFRILGAFDETLGPPIDDQCSVETRVDYYYRTAGGELRELQDEANIPGDVGETTTSEGITVPYIIRLVTGTTNRGIYQLSLLHDPRTPEPAPSMRPDGWNGKLIYRFGGGCRGGWHRQGSSVGGNMAEDVMLSQGYALASNSLNVYGNNCNDLLAAESMMMTKERFVETYGAPEFTIGWGCSGGSYANHQIGDNYPGLLDGIVAGCTFPEVGFATVMKLADSRLLDHYFDRANTKGEVTWSEEQQRAVSGFIKFESIANMDNGAARIDPVPGRPDRLSAEFHPVVPMDVRYDPDTNPDGARPTVQDHYANAYGRDLNGFGLWPYDNIGVQYGLKALNDGVITWEQFVDLNREIGGYDVDAGFVPQRSEHDRHATRRAYISGRMLNGGGGLAEMPIIDYRAYSDDLPNGDIHMRYHSFSTRERLLNANGHYDNQIMLQEDFRFGFFSLNSPRLREALSQMDRWLENIAADASDQPRAAKVVNNIPADLEEACWTKDPDPVKIVEEQRIDEGECAALYPVSESPRIVAGGPVASNVVACQLHPVKADNYAIPMTPGRLAELRDLFPHGVCDWSRDGEQQRDLQGTWLSFGPSKVNFINVYSNKFARSGN